MAENHYYVVYEYNESMIGAYGLRFRAEFESETEFQTATKDYVLANVIKAGCTDEECLNLTSLTPEICRLMGTANEAFTKNPNPSKAEVGRIMDKTIYTIICDRNRIKAFDLVRVDASKYIAAFSKLIEDSPLTIKIAFMDALLIKCYNEYGQVDLSV